MANSFSLAAMMPPRTWGQEMAQRERRFNLNMAMQNQQAVENERQRLSLEQFKSISEKVDALPVLDPDKVRVKAKFDTLMKGIGEKIKTEFNGDAITWLKEMSSIDGQKLISEVNNSEEMQVAGLNKRNYAAYLSDKQKKGITQRLINTGVVGSNGKPVYMTADGAWNLFQSGSMKSFTYNGSYETPKDWEDSIRKSYSPDGTIDRAVPASREEKMAAIISKGGLSELDLNDFNNQTGVLNKPVYYNFDPYKFQNLQLAKQRVNLDNKEFQWRMVVDKFNMEKDKEGADTMDALQAFNRGIIGEDSKLSYDSGQSISPLGEKFVKTRVGAVTVPGKFITNTLSAYNIPYKEDGSINPTSPVQLKFMNGQDELLPPDAMQGARYTGKVVKLTGYKPGKGGKLEGQQNGYGIEVEFNLPEKYAESLMNKTTGDRVEGTIGSSTIEGMVPNDKSLFGWALGAFQPNGNSYKTRAIIDLSDMNGVQRALLKQRNKIKNGDMIDGIDPLIYLKEFYSGQQSVEDGQIDLDN